MYTRLLYGVPRAKGPLIVASALNFERVVMVVWETVVYRQVSPWRDPRPSFLYGVMTC